MITPSPTANAQDVTANPFAFPFPAERNSWGDGIREGSNGMTLRDWFAGQVLASAAALPLGIADYEHRAKVAYGQADAMLAARQTTPAAELQMQHVGYYDEDGFDWMAGIKPRNCELFAARPEVQA